METLHVNTNNNSNSKTKGGSESEDKKSSGGRKGAKSNNRGNSNVGSFSSHQQPPVANGSMAASDSDSVQLAGDDFSGSSASSNSADDDESKRKSQPISSPVKSVKFINQLIANSEAALNGHCNNDSSIRNNGFIDFGANYTDKNNGCLTDTRKADFYDGTVDRLKDDSDDRVKTTWVERKAVDNNKCDKRMNGGQKTAETEDGNVYNEYINYLCMAKEEDELEKPLLKKKNKHSDKVGYEHYPKSIVKSPSALNFQQQQNGGGGGKNAKNMKPRLSLQGSDDEDTQRPVLHVKFVGSSSHDDPESGRTETDPLTSASNGHRCSNSCDSNCSKKSVCCSSNSFVSFSGSEASGSSSSGSSSNENSSLDQFSEARPPDGGWGWVVVFASFLINMIADGITFSFGVIYVEFLSYFGEGKAKTAWIGSLFMAMPLLSGPIASFLTDRYGCRKVTVAGSIMASTGFILSAFADSMEMLYFTFGILSGFGLSLCYVAAVVIVAYYFDKKRSFATGLSVCGSGIGTFIFAPIIQILIEEYGWRGTTLILAGVFLNMGVCGLLMRDLEWTTYRAKSKKRKDQEEKSRRQNAISSDSFSVSNSTNTGGVSKNGDEGVDQRLLTKDDLTTSADPRLFSSLIMLPTFLKNGEKVPQEVLELLSTHRNFVMLNNYSGLTHSRSFSEPITNDTAGKVVHEEGEKDDKQKKLTVDKRLTTENEKTFMEIIKRNQSRRHRHHDHHPTRIAKPSAAYLNDLRMHRHSLTYRGAMLNINRYRLRASSCPDIYRNSMTTIAKEKSYWYQGIKEFKNLFADILDFSHFADIRFSLFALSNLLLYTWYDVPYVYIADYAISFGVTEKSASLLLSIVGIVNMFGEVSG